MIFPAGGLEFAMKTLLIAVLGFGVGVITAHTEMLKVGDKAPAFTAIASDGSTVRLADYIGKSPVVLYFYPKDDTTRLHERSLRYP